MNTLLHTIVAGILAVGSFLGIYHAPVSQINPDNAVPLGAYNPTGGGTYRLQSSVSSSASTITLSSFKEPVSLIPYTMSYLNSSIEYATLEPQSSTKEFISFTGITQNSDGSATLTGVTRGLGFSYPYTASTTLQQAHPAQAILILSNPPQLTNQYVNKNNDETITGTLSAPEPTASSNVATKNYVDTHVNGGTVSTDHVSVAGIAGETVYAGQIVYFKSSDQRWYKASITDGLASTTQIGVAQGAGTAGNAISGGVTISGLDTNQIGLSLGSTYYLSATAGATSTTKSGRVIGQAKSATNLYVDQNVGRNPMWGGFNFTAPTYQPASSTVLSVDGTGQLSWITNGNKSYLNLAPSSAVGTASTTIFSMPISANTLSTSNYYKGKLTITGASGGGGACATYLEIGFGNASSTYSFISTADAGTGSLDFLLAGNGATNSQKLYSTLFYAATTTSSGLSTTTQKSASPSFDSTTAGIITAVGRVTGASPSCYVVPSFVNAEYFN